MKITVLGSSGYGYPLVFCCCEYCKKARELSGKNIRKRASILINDEMIIDLTPDCQVAMNMYGKDMSKVKFLLQTHTHLDHFDMNHFSSLDSKYLTKLRDKFNLICSTKCMQDIHEKLSKYDNMNLIDEHYLNRINLKTFEVNHGEILEISGYKIKAIHCLHDEKLGAQLYLISYNNKTILYATDTPQITEIALEELKGNTIDCLFLDESFGLKDYSFSHLNIKGFCEYVNTLKNNNFLSSDCKVFATHITHDGNPCHDELENILKKYGYNAAYDGLEINL